MAIGWRWESIDTVKTPSAPCFMTSGNEGTLGGCMASFPNRGWSDRARCHVAFLHSGQLAPSSSCSCGYRIVASVELSLHYLFRGEAPRWNTNLSGLVLVRVESDGDVVADRFSAPLHPWQCVNAKAIRPVWPAFVINDHAADLMSAHYGTNEIYCLNKWRDAANRWKQIKETRHVPSAV